MSFILPFINILNLGELALAVLVMIPLVLDAIVYTLVAYSVKVFKLMCTLNFNSIYGIIQPLVDRLQAVIIVFVAFLLGKQLIEYMLNPDSAGKKGATLLKNIFIATALFISYNFIFTVFNELNIALMGNEYGYKYTALSEVVDLDDEDMDKDKTGVITRFIFGKNAENMADPGETIAFNLLGSFIREKDSSNPAPSLKTYITTDRYGRKLSDGHYRFWNILRFDFARIITGDNPLGPLDYTFIISTIVGGFVVYSMFKASIQIGIRMFKLLILQMVAPIVIVDIIQNGFGGKFKTWSKRYIAVFLEALVRMLTMFIITVFVSQFILHIGDYFPKLESQQGFFTKLIIMIIVVIAAYMFAGEVPKFIDELIGTNLGESSKGNPLGKLLGMGIGAAAGFAGGLRTGGIGGAFAGLGKGALSGAREGGKGKTISDLFKAGKGAKNDARSLGTNVRHAGGLRAYAGSRAQEMLGIPQRHIEQANRATERQTALENMVKSLEDGYDRQMIVTNDYGLPLLDDDGNAITVGVDREKFTSYAYDKNNVNGFYHFLSEKTQKAVDRTNAAKAKLDSAQAAYEEAYQRGDKDQIQAAKSRLTAAQNEYSIIKADTDKKISTDFDSIMIEDAKNGKNIKERNQNEVNRSMENYDLLAEKGYSTDDIVAGTTNTKSIKDRNTEVKDIHNNQRSVNTFNNRGGNSGSGGNSK